MLGTERMGDVASMYAVSSWLRDDVAVVIADSATVAMRIRDELAEIWQDHAAKDALWHLQLGILHTRQLVEGIERLAALVDSCASALISLGARVVQAESLAITGKLNVEPGRLIHIPLWEEHVPVERVGDPPEDYYDRKADFDSRREAYTEAATVLVEALEPIEDLLERVAEENEFDWKGSLFFAAGDFVAAETHVLAKRALQSSGRIATAVGFVSRATVRAAPIIAVAGVVYDIHSGSDYRKSIAKGATGLGASTGVVKVLLAPGITPIRLAGLLVVGALSGAVTAWGVDKGYELIFSPETPKDKLFHETVESAPTPWDRPGPLPRQRQPSRLNVATEQYGREEGYDD